MKSYRSMFEENWKPVKVPADNRKGYKIRYDYIGQWYFWNTEKQVLRQTKGFIGFLFVLSLVCYVFGALADSTLTYSRLVALPGTMALAAMLIETVGIVQFCLAKERLTSQYFSDINTKLRLGSFFHAALLIWAAAAAGISLIGKQPTLADVMVPLGFLASAILAGGELFLYLSLPQGRENNIQSDS